LTLFNPLIDFAFEPHHPLVTDQAAAWKLAAMHQFPDIRIIESDLVADFDFRKQTRRTTRTVRFLAIMLLPADISRQGLSVNVLKIFGDLRRRRLAFWFAGHVRLRLRSEGLPKSKRHSERCKIALGVPLSPYRALHGKPLLHLLDVRAVIETSRAERPPLFSHIWHPDRDCNRNGCQ
jgi:hypothetical protein